MQIHGPVLQVSIFLSRKLHGIEKLAKQKNVLGYRPASSVKIGIAKFVFDVP